MQIFVGVEPLEQRARQILERAHGVARAETIVAVERRHIVICEHRRRL